MSQRRTIVVNGEIKVKPFGDIDGDWIFVGDERVPFVALVQRLVSQNGRYVTFEAKIERVLGAKAAKGQADVEWGVYHVSKDRPAECIEKFKIDDHDVAALLRRTVGKKCSISMTFAPLKG